MPTVRADRLAPVLVALALVAGGCAGADAPESPVAPSPRADVSDAPVASPGRTERRTPPAVEGMAVPPDLDQAFTRLLEDRARAVLEQDREAFLAVLDQGDDDFLLRQQGYFDNLVQLPLAAFSYAVDGSSLVRGDRSYSVVVEVTTQLDGFDALPVRTLDRFRFDQVARRGAATPRYRLASVTDRAWEEAHDVREQPWDERPVQVRSRPGVLAVFDDDSVAQARPLLRALEQAVRDVAGRVPYPWDADVVVYALSDTDFVRSLDDLPGDDPDDLDGIAFSVPAGRGDPRTAATRVVLNPRLLTTGDVARDRLLRHELVHVAVGERADHAPTWLSEGLAEWVSVQALPERSRRIGTDALRSARRGVETMPDDATFNDDDTSIHYAVSWWAVEYVAATYGPTAPWAVLDAFAAPETRESPTIQALLQISLAKLARRGAELLVDTYAPAGRGDGPRVGDANLPR